KTYNTRDSLVVTHPTTNLALSSLSMGERTGSRIFWRLWSYVVQMSRTEVYNKRCKVCALSSRGRRRRPLSCPTACHTTPSVSVNRNSFKIMASIGSRKFSFPWLTRLFPSNCLVPFNVTETSACNINSNCNRAISLG
ncbi:uncharacterized protein BCR38DRAFT_353109, partial [Pseudomassariella vexata]